MYTCFLAVSYVSMSSKSPLIHPNIHFLAEVGGFACKLGLREHFYWLKVDKVFMANTRASRSCPQSVTTLPRWDSQLAWSLSRTCLQNEWFLTFTENWMNTVREIKSKKTKKMKMIDLRSRNMWDYRETKLLRIIHRNCVSSFPADSCLTNQNIIVIHFRITPILRVICIPRFATRRVMWHGNSLFNSYET
jgi:hypothetical protein